MSRNDAVHRTSLHASSLAARRGISASPLRHHFVTTHRTSGTSPRPTALLPAVDLARFLEDTEKQAAEEGTELPESIDLMEIPANRRDVAPVQYQATLEEALHQFDSTQAEALYVQRHVAPMIQRVYGVVLQTDIESYYQYRRS